VKRLILSFFFIAQSFLTENLWAFPEMIRHNYVNCTSCHWSPTGGGLLTPYGRTLSGEVASTWAMENEGAFLWGAVKTPKWLQMGGDLRFVQVFRNNRLYKEAKFITMQADLEAGVQVDKFSFVGTIGKSDNTNAKTVGEALVSHRHYLMYQATENLSLRFGKFQKAYGINDPNHYLVTKRGLGWDQNTETYNLEAAYLAEEYDVQVTGLFGRFDQPSLIRDQGVAVRGAYALSDGAKIGASYLYGDNKRNSRHVFGPFAMLGVTKRLFVLTEVNFQSLSPKAATNYFGAASYTKIGYEIYKGVVPFFQAELAKTNFNAPNTEVLGYGLGIQWLPRPHFEYSALFQKMKVRAADDSFGDFAWLIFHWYP
jgi:hypothetical protein